MRHNRYPGIIQIILHLTRYQISHEVLYHHVRHGITPLLTRLVNILAGMFEVTSVCNELCVYCRCSVGVGRGKNGNGKQTKPYAHCMYLRYI